VGEISDYDFLLATGAFFYRGEFGDADEPTDWIPDGGLAINLNDAFFWACADFEAVTKDEIAEVARIYRRYGQCGLYYWACKKTNGWKVEFKDTQRMIDFVRREEEQIAREPSSSKRAYMDLPK
jgi:hypothetical protein